MPIKSEKQTGTPTSRVVDLDDPADFELIEEQPPDTRRPAPEHDSASLAAHVETAGTRATVPPAPSYEMLRDSCKWVAAADTGLEDEPKVSGVHPSQTPAVREILAELEERPQNAPAIRRK